MESRFLKASFETLRRVAIGLAEMTEQIFDLHLAFARHWTARFRRRFINPDLGVFSLCEELDFAQWCRRELKKPTDPELQAWREEGLDLFEGFESGTKVFH
jgi:hypothetical protein